jgi:hypothetical protein
VVRINVDTAAPNAPTVGIGSTTPTPTQTTTPTWEWASVDGNGSFRYGYEDDANWIAEDVTDLNYTEATPQSDATYVMYVQERDAAGNWSDSGQYSITIDTQVPNVTFTIDDPDTSKVATNNEVVTLYLTCDDLGGAPCTDMRFSNDGTFSNPEDAWQGSFSATPSWDLWTLDTVEESKTVWAQVRDGAGNESSVEQMSIVVDQTDPVITLNEVSPGVVSPQNLFIGTDYETNELGATAVDADLGIDGKIMIDFSDVETSVVDDYTVYYDVTDWAGNTAQTVTRTVHVFNQAEPPTDFDVPTSSTTGDFTLTWTASADAEGYEIEESTTGAFTGIPNLPPVALGSTESFDVTGRDPGTYYYQIRAIHGVMTPSDWVDGGVGCVVPIPTEASPSVSATSPAFSWSFPINWGASPTPSAQYTLEMSTDETFATGVSQVYQGDLLQATATVVTSGTYYFRVQATALGQAPSVWTISSAIVVPPMVASVPWVSASSTASTRTFWVSWGASATPGVTYELQMSKDDPTFASPTWPYSGSVTSGSVNLTSSGTYYFRVRATKAGYISTSWVPTSGTVASVVTSVPWISANSTASTRAFWVSWGASTTPGVTYELQTSKNDPTFASPTWSYTGTSTTGSASLTSSGTYYFRVRAKKDGFAITPWRTSGGTVASVVTSVPWISANSTASTRTFWVSWGASSTPGVTYELQTSKDDPTFVSPTWSYTGSSTTGSASLTSSGTYYFRVRAKKDGFAITPWVTSGGTVASVTTSVPWINANSTASTETFWVSWGASSTPGVTYELQTSKDDPTFASPTWSYTGSSTTGSASLTSSGTYYFRVRAKKDGFAVTPWVTSGGTTTLF